FKSLQKMYPDERLFASPLEEVNGMFGYKAQIQSEMLNFCRQEILNLIPEEKFFPCHDAI
ncbi:MAG: DNA photolyase, partial [Gammaproteobacteria bacterium]